MIRTCTNIPSLLLECQDFYKKHKRNLIPLVTIASNMPLYTNNHILYMKCLKLRSKLEKNFEVLDLLRDTTQTLIESYLEAADLYYFVLRDFRNQGQPAQVREKYKNEKQKAKILRNCSKLQGVGLEVLRDSLALMNGVNKLPLNVGEMKDLFHCSYWINQSFHIFSRSVILED